jgi:hypothetical protein
MLEGHAFTSDNTHQREAPSSLRASHSLSSPQMRATSSRALQLPGWKQSAAPGLMQLRPRPVTRAFQGPTPGAPTGPAKGPAAGCKTRLSKVEADLSSLAAGQRALVAGQQQLIAFQQQQAISLAGLVESHANLTERMRSISLQLVLLIIIVVVFAAATGSGVGTHLYMLRLAVKQ